MEFARDQWSAAAASWTMPQLSPLMTLADALLGHGAPLAPLTSLVDRGDGAATASYDLAQAHALVHRWLRAVFAAPGGLRDCLAALGLELRGMDTEAAPGVVCLAATTGDDRRALSKQEVYELAAVVEARLAVAGTVLDTLPAVAGAVTKACMAFIGSSSCADLFDGAALAKCRVQGGAFFNEEWSVGMETAWQASGAEGILTMPSYAQWTEKHMAHRLKSWRGVDAEAEVGGPGGGLASVAGRLWRFEYWECLRTPCHEVIHLVQHLAGQTMSHQLAEHDGAFSTYLLMMAVANFLDEEKGSEGGGGEAREAEEEGKEQQQEQEQQQQQEPPSYYYPGAVEEALIESVDFVRRTHEHATPEAAELWDEKGQAEYMRWRDSWGAADMSDTSWGPAPGAKGKALPFGGNMKIENLAKNMVAMEATCPAAARQVLQGKEEVAEAATAMLETMFRGRTDQVCDGKPVDIRPAVRLAGTPVSSRIEQLVAPCGMAAAKALLGELEIKSLPVADATAGSAAQGKVADEEAEAAETTSAPQGLLVIMRHGQRLDDTRAEEGKEPAEAEWPDRVARPYDTPLVPDPALPFGAARTLQAAGVGVARIVSSPFRRCLQTATLVAAAMGVPRVDVDNQLGEALHAVDLCFRRAGQPEGGDVQYLSLEEARAVVAQASSLAATAAAATAAGAAAAGAAAEDPKGAKDVGRDVGDAGAAIYRTNEVELGAWDREVGKPTRPDAVTQRAGTAIAAMAPAADGQNILVVTHGDLFNAYMPELFDGIGKYKAEYAGLAVLRPPHGKRATEEAIMETFRVEQL